MADFLMCFEFSAGNSFMSPLAMFGGLYFGGGGHMDAL